MVNVFAMSARPDRVKPNTCYFFAKHATLTSKSKDWRAGNQDNEIAREERHVDPGTVVQLASYSTKIKLSMLVCYTADIIVISEI
jgi:hypothetical protein